MSVLPATILSNVAKAMVATQKYASLDEALWEMARTTVRGKVNHYRRRIRHYEGKYSTDFDSFTARLKGRATPAEEDDWLAWRSARRMLSDWSQTYQELIHAQLH